jgi:hypothetical protein
MFLYLKFMLKVDVNFTKAHFQTEINNNHSFDESLNKNALFNLIETEEGLIQVNDFRSPIQKTIDITKAILRHTETIATKIKRRFFSWIQICIDGTQLPTPFFNKKSNAYTYPVEQLPWHYDDESSGLFLDIHGLRASPTDWQLYEQEFKKQYPCSHHFLPKVVLGGNCSLEIAAKPLLEVVENYLKKFPGKSVTLIGTSNGGRIAAYIESKLDPLLLGESKLIVVSIAGVHNGTKFIDFLESIHMLSLARLAPELADEFHWSSCVAQENLKAWQSKQVIWNKNGNKVFHLFIATMEDENVWGQSASLPQAPQNTTKTKHIVYNGETHTSIVEAAFPKVSKFVNKNLL